MTEHLVSGTAAAGGFQVRRSANVGRQFCDIVVQAGEDLLAVRVADGDGADAGADDAAGRPGGDRLGADRASASGGDGTVAAAAAKRPRMPRHFELHVVASAGVGAHARCSAGSAESRQAPRWWCRPASRQPLLPRFGGATAWDARRRRRPFERDSDCQSQSAKASATAASRASRRATATPRAQERATTLVEQDRVPVLRAAGSMDRACESTPDCEVLHGMAGRRRAANRSSASPIESKASDGRPYELVRRSWPR